MWDLQESEIQSEESEIQTSSGVMVSDENESPLSLPLEKQERLESHRPCCRLLQTLASTAKVHFHVEGKRVTSQDSYVSGSKTLQRYRGWR